VPCRSLNPESGVQLPPVSFPACPETGIRRIARCAESKKTLYIPVVLSRDEIDAILMQLSYPYNLVVKLLFGCGLRLFECLQIRVRDFNFDAGILTIHGKGKKDRTVPLCQFR